MQNCREQILQEILQIYNPKPVQLSKQNLVSTLKAKLPFVSKLQQFQEVQGLEQISKDPLFQEFQNITLPNAQNFNIYRPSEKTTVLILGNHSAGKSSFVNWFIGQELQKVGIAIETTDFTVITHGNFVQQLTGEGTFMRYPHFRDLVRNSNANQINQLQKQGFINHLVTKVISNEKILDIDFIDTPGLADGDIDYVYDVNAVLKFLVQQADLVLVFLDPIGQATCQRTMKFIQSVYQENEQKIKFYLTKADTIPENEKNKLLCQITSTLSRVIGCRHAWDLPCIYIPSKNREGINQIDQLEKEILQRQQSKTEQIFVKLDKDLIFAENHIENIAIYDYNAKQRNNWCRMLQLLGFFMLLLSLLSYIFAFGQKFLNQIEFLGNDSTLLQAFEISYTLRILLLVLGIAIFLAGNILLQKRLSKSQISKINE